MKLIAYLFIGLFATISQAQDLYDLNLTKSSVQIEGSSSLHDWEMEAKELAGNFDLNEDKLLENLIFEATVSGLVSDKSKMTKLAQKALKIKERLIQKQKSDADFNQDGYKQLNWIFKQTPMFESAYNRYPIYKLSKG